MFWLMDSMPYATTLNLTSPHKFPLVQITLDYSSRVNPMPPSQASIHAGSEAYTRKIDLSKPPQSWLNRFQKLS
jgi:hypothetical protein